MARTERKTQLALTQCWIYIPVERKKASGEGREEGKEREREKEPDFRLPGPTP